MIGNKRGISAIVAWVLLLGFAIALATMIFLWMSEQTETMSESTVEYVEGEMQCQDVRMNVRDVSAGGDNPCSKLEISNAGTLTISHVVVREFCSDGSTFSQNPLPIDLKPRSSKTEQTGDYKTTVPRGGGKFCNLLVQGCDGCKKVEIMPIVQISDRQIGCKDRTIEVECS